MLRIINNCYCVEINELFYFDWNADWKYCVIQCTGYLKSWAPAKTGLEEQEGEADGEACNLSCLVAVGRLQPAMPTPSLISGKPQLRSIEFVSRHAMDGKFLFVDQRFVLQIQSPFEFFSLTIHYCCNIF